MTMYQYVVETGLDKGVTVLIIVLIAILTAVLASQQAQSLYTIVLRLGYLGAFIAGLVGTSSLMISFFPPQVVVFLMSDPSLGFNPFLLGVLAGLGAGIGQYAHYYVGTGGRYLLSEKYRAGLDKWRVRIEKYGPVIIFLFAATPLSPDDLIWIPLGMMRYPKVKALVASILGKSLMLVVIAYGGYYGMEAIRDLAHAYNLF